MNYRHIYHAGSFTDVMKHNILIMLLQKLKEKDKPFTVLDVFAGIGIYDLTSLEAQKTNEYINGIKVILDHAEDKDNYPKALADYLSVGRELNIGEEMKLYPGSPYIIASLLRPCDNLIAAELHPQDFAILKHNMKMHFEKAAIHHIDGYHAIKAFLPPQNNRGLVLLDAAFEVKNEYLKIIDALKLIKKRFAAGIVMIWYPIKDHKLVESFYSSLSSTGYKSFLKIEFEIEDQLVGMNKCGVVIANPPYIQDELEELFKYLAQKIYKNKAKYLVQPQQAI